MLSALRFIPDLHRRPCDKAAIWVLNRYVQVAAGDAVTRTDPLGGFVLSGVAADTATVLQLAGKGLHLRAEVPAGSTDAVVVHCDIEEV